MIVLVDANILIDLWFVDGLFVLPRLGRAEVLDVVLAECDDPRQPGLLDQVERLGSVVVKTEYSWWKEACRMKTASLSVQDSLNLYYAKVYNRVL